MEYPDSKNVTASNLCSSGSPIHIESIVKITVSPNTPSPSLSPEPGHDHKHHHNHNHDERPCASEPVEKVRCSVAVGGESFQECSSSVVPTTILTDVGAMGNCKNLTSYQKIEDSQGQPSVSLGNHNISNSSSSSEQQQQQYHHHQHEQSNTTDLPLCFDFGIQDYLCRRLEETEFDLSSDTDTSYLGASPPFDEALCQSSSIEAMPINIDTRLNLQDDDDDDLSREEVEELASRLSLNLKDTQTSSNNFFGQSMSKDSLLSFHHVNPSPHHPPPTSAPSNGPNHNDNDTKSKLYQERRFPRPFRRNISLPAIFKSYLQQNTEFSNLRDKKGGHDKGAMTRAETLTNKSTSTHHRLSRIESISNSSQVNLADGQDSLTSSMTSVASNWNSGSVDSDAETEPFTSELEKRSLMIRYMRSRLIRQNTTGNVAPADYHI